jgi:2-keto-4-pentenoate hydratase
LSRTDGRTANLPAQAAIVTADEIEAASDLLFDHWRRGARLAALPQAFRPATRGEGYAIQACLERRPGARLFGWKIAATSTAGQAHIGVDGPLAGRLLANRVIADGGTAPTAGNAMRVAEIEYAFRMGAPLPPRAAPYDVREVLAAVESLHPAIEIPDSRFEDYVRAGAAQLIADNACGHLFVLGAAAAADWRAIDLAEHRPRALVSGRPEVVGCGANVLGDPRTALVWLVNELSQLGLTLGAGQVVTTGTCLYPLDIGAGDEVAADFGRLGRVSVGFA